MSVEVVMPETLLLREGQLVEHFKIKRLLGRGGMSQVFLARDLRLGRNVALKLIDPDLLGSWDTVRAFLQEARATARFNHPHIVSIYAVGEYEDSPYVALEYLEGQSLRERMQEGDLPLKEVLRLSLAVCEALIEAHHHHVLHCDLKPENILLPHDGRLRVVDFGLARILSSQGEVAQKDDTAKSSTEDNSLVTQIRGTPAYMAPEQWLRGALLSSATDVWALGVMLFEMLVGQRPFQGKDLPELRSDICQEHPLPAMPDRVPGEVRLLIEACLERSPERRISVSEIELLLQQMLDVSPSIAVGVEEPFRGLEAFRENQSHLFFGRDAEIAAFLEKIRRYPVLPVVGPSGAGKSSFVSAGVVPRLREQGRWLVVRMRPQREPFLTLAHRLWTWIAKSTTSSGTFNLSEISANLNAEQGLAERMFQEPRLLSILLHRIAESHRKQVLLVVDQLEELLTLVPDANTRHRFVEALYGAAEDATDPVRLVFTLRDDFLGRFAETHEAQQMLSHVTLLRIPDPASLRDILVRPVEQLGYRYPSEDLVQRMILEVEGETASLPLLQFACQILWERRDQTTKTLSEAVYEEIGGVGGALPEHADGVLRQLPNAQVQAVRELFLRLVTPEKTRRVAWQHELLDGLGADGEIALNSLVQARLLAVHQSNTEVHQTENIQVEIIHESLVQRWQTLHQWIDESHEEQAFLQEIRQASEMWERRGQRLAEVWEGEALQEALAFRQRYPHRLPRSAEQFLQAGQQRESRRRRTRQLLFAGLVAVAGILLVLSLLASLVLQRKNTEISERWALAQQYATRTALLRHDHLGAYAHLRASLENRDSPALRTFWRRLKFAPLLWQRHLNTALEDVSFLPQKGNYLAVAGRRGGLFVLHTRTGRKWLLRGHRGHVMSVTFSHDGKWMASGSWSGRIRLWRRTQRTFVPAGSWRAHRSPVQSLTFHPKWPVLASAAYDGVRLWNWKEKKELPWRFLHGWKGKQKIAWSRIRRRRANTVVFDANGTWLALAGYGVVYMIHWPTRRIRSLRMSSERIYSLAFSPNHRWLATVGWDRQISILDLKRWRLRRIPHGHTNVVTSVAFSANNRWLATAGFDKTIRLWRLPSWTLSRILRGHTNVIRQIAFAPQGQWLASVSGDQTLRIWRVKGSTERWKGSGHSARVTSLSFGPLGKIIASGSGDRTIRLWDSWTGKPLLSLRGHTNAIRSVALSPDGMRLVSNGYDKTTRIWRIQRSYSAGGEWRGREIHRFRDYSMPRFKKPFSMEGNKLLMMRGPLLHVWDFFSLQRSLFWDAGRASPSGRSKRNSSQLSDVAFHPNGSLVVSADFSRQVKLWKLSDHSLVRSFQAPEVQLEIQIDPTGQYIASMGRAPHIYLWGLSSDEKQTRVLRGHKGYVSGLAFGPVGKNLASSSTDGSVRLWDLKSGKSRVLLKRKRRQAFYEVAFRPDGGQVAAASSDQRIYLWDLPSGAMHLLPGHIGGITGLTYSPDSKILASSGNDGTLRLWLSQEARPLWRTAALLPQRGLLLTHQGWRHLFPKQKRKNQSKKPKTQEKRKSRVDTQEKRKSWVNTQEKRKAQPEIADTLWAKKLERKAWQSQTSANGRFLAIQVSQDRIEMWDTHTNKRMFAHTLSGLAQFKVDRTGRVWALARHRLWMLRLKKTTLLSPSQSVVAFVLHGATVWVATRKHILHLTPKGETFVFKVLGHTGGRVSVLQVLGAWLAVGYHSGQLRWFIDNRKKLSSKKPPRLIGLPLSTLTHILAGPEQTVVLGYQNGTIGVWSMTSGRRLEKIRLHGAVQHLVIQQRYLVGATSLGNSMVWDLRSYQLTHCQLLQDVWKSVPMVWDKGQIVIKPPPEGHKCQARKK